MKKILPLLLVIFVLTAGLISCQSPSSDGNGDHTHHTENVSDSTTETKSEAETKTDSVSQYETKPVTENDDKNWTSNY